MIRLARRGFSQFCRSKLDSGIEAISINTPGYFSGTGILIKTGHLTAMTKANPRATASSYILEKLAFKETAKVSAAQMQARMDELVGSAMSKSHRESLFISAAISPDQVKPVLQLLGDIAGETVVRPGDLKEMQQVVEYELQELENKPEELLPELAHGPAFYPQSVSNGNSLLSVPEVLKSIRVEDVYSFREKALHPSNIYVLGAGMEHDELLDMSQGILSAGTNEKGVEGPIDLRYFGGPNYIKQADLPFVHVALAFEGLPASHPDTYAMAVLQMLLGGGGSFSAGGPGKGMYSRLYTQVLNRHHWVESAKVFNHAYSMTGVFGIHGAAIPSHAKELCLVLLGQFHSLATRPVGPEEFERAKNQVKSAILMGLESRLTQLEDMADQITYRGSSSLETPLEVCKRIDQVTPEDIQRIVKQMGKSVPTVVAYGPIDKMPDYYDIRDWTRRSL